MTSEYIGLAFTDSPYFTLLYHNGAGTVTFADSYTLAGRGNAIAASPNGLYFAIAHSGSPYFTLLALDRGNGTVSLAATYTLPNTGRAVAFDPDGVYIAVGHQDSPRFTLLHHSPPGQVSLAATYTMDLVQGAAFTSDSAYIALANENDPQLTLLYHNAGTLAFADSYTLFTLGSGGGRAVDFSPDDLYLAVGWNTTFSGAEFLTLLYMNPPGTITFADRVFSGSQDVHGVSFNPDGTYLAVARLAHSGGQESPIFQLFEQSGGSLSLSDTAFPTDSGGESGRACAFNAQGDYIGVGQGEVFRLLYQNAGTVGLTDSYTPGNLAPGVLGVAFSPPVASEGNPPFNAAAQQAQKLLLL